MIYDAKAVQAAQNRCFVCEKLIAGGNWFAQAIHGDWTIRLCCAQCPQHFFAQRLPVLWAMHLIVRCSRLAPGQNKPEKCPKCAMKLVERR